MKKIFLLIVSLTIYIVSYSQCQTCSGKGYIEQSTICPYCHYGYVESTVTRDCTTCYGRGTLPTTCDECGGKGTSLKKVTYKCPDCGGSGYVLREISQGQCPDCKGTGNTEQRISSWTSGTECPRCKGRGILYKTEKTYCHNCVQGYVSKMEQVTCEKCKGNGTIQTTCPTCHGQRHYTEKTQTPCSVCGGTGHKTIKITCPTCHGYN